MKESIFIELLKSFSPKDINKFKKFIKSPYFNNRKIIHTLYNEIVKYYPHFNNEIFTKKQLYFAITKKKKYNDNTIRGLLSVLDKLAYIFIGAESISKNKRLYANILLKEFNSKGIVNPFIYFLNSCEDLYSKNDRIDTQLFYDKYIFESHKFNFSSINDKFINSKKKLSEHMTRFEGMAEDFIIFFITTLISDYIPVIIYHYEFEFKIRDFISKIFLETTNLWALYDKIKTKNPYAFFLEMHLRLIDAFENINNDTKYYEYKENVFINTGKITKDELGFHICCLINLCNMKNNNNFKEEILKEEYELYLFQVKFGLYIDNKVKYLPSDLFRSIIILGTKLRDFENVENFITEHYSELRPNERKNYYNFGYAFLRFIQGNYNEAIHYSVKVSVDNYILKYDMRNLTLKLYYELNEYEKAFDLIHSYYEFLDNNIFTSSEKKIIYSNFLKYTKKLLLYKSGDNKIDIDYLFNKFKKEKQIGDKEWLNDKFEEILMEQKIKKKA